ncbi:AsnC family transcriptional regulator [Teichococcus aestuarii]|uniref:AsnC family transcriptional regulator n=1 Tax=Teichococcus aestuarii TaxID=568898 RepID=UPI0036061EA5
MDQTDRRILRALARNARLTNAELAEEVGLSPPLLEPGEAAGAGRRDPGLCGAAGPGEARPARHRLRRGDGREA